MWQRNHRFPKRILLILAWLVVGVIIAGCQGVLVSYQGARVQDGYGIAIEAGSEKGGYYQTRDLQVRYQYDYAPGELRIAGAIAFTDAIQMNFNQVSSFNLSLVFADAERNVLANYGLKTIGSWYSHDELPFSRALPVPQGTALMVFTYRGDAQEYGYGGYARRGYDDDQISTTFWEVPIVR